MIQCTEYDLATGRLGMCMEYPNQEFMDANSRENVGNVSGHYSADTHYVSYESVLERPTQATALDGLTLSGLPAPCTLWIDHVSYPVTDSTVTLDLPIAGTYRLRVEAFPYIDWTGSVTV